jgi:hypothetical protein
MAWVLSVDLRRFRGRDPAGANTSREIGAVTGVGGPRALVTPDVSMAPST